MKPRSDMIEWTRGELLGPGVWLKDPEIATFVDNVFSDSNSDRTGPLAWQPIPGGPLEEVLYFGFPTEPPKRKYGAGLLHPISQQDGECDDPALVALGNTPSSEFLTEEEINEGIPSESGGVGPWEEEEDESFSAVSENSFKPSTIGLSFHSTLSPNGSIVVHLPQEKRFTWQDASSQPCRVNGVYERGTRRVTSGNGYDSHVWKRRPAFDQGATVIFESSELQHLKKITKHATTASNVPLKITVDLYPRKQPDGAWLVTVVLRNRSAGSDDTIQTLYQAYFEISILQGTLSKYPESSRPVEDMDDEEQSLLLLYQDCAVWGIGHGCSAGWEFNDGETPDYIFADVLPAVELPSMTPDIKDQDGKDIKIHMRDLVNLTDDGKGAGWDSINNLCRSYQQWINQKKEDVHTNVPDDLQPIAQKHIRECELCMTRISNGVDLLRQSDQARKAFRLANLSILLQQISTKQVQARPLKYDQSMKKVIPFGEYTSPWSIYENGAVSSRLGKWRAFQIAFILMSLKGMHGETKSDREIVDLIWFPTGGGKTEAYLGCLAYFMFLERFKIPCDDSGLERDGTNAIMRYTLRMLTTQQFQRASSLICAMDFLRRHPSKHQIVEEIPGRRFSLGLWIGGEGSPNKIDQAITKWKKYVSDDKSRGNPLILSSCPWCNTEIGICKGERPKGVRKAQWPSVRVAGIQIDKVEGPILGCSDPRCEFGKERIDDRLPVEVIDERIYQKTPSLIIGTADKLAIIAYRPEASRLFGINLESQGSRFALPPGLIIQDELHLISGPLGTMYGLYEGVFEKLCSYEKDEHIIKPKIIASTATIRGADHQVRSLYNRSKTSLFPAPCLNMSDSYFGTYAKDKNGKLLPGRMYLGIHADNYGSVLTSQRNSFASCLFRPYAMEEEDRDPWWTLLAFYNSIRELGGAKTLFDSDVRSRLKFLFNREGFKKRRHLYSVEELTSRLAQSEIVEMMNQLSNPYDPNTHGTIDAALASNIIEVGVDIDRLSLMGVVGQPKSTSTYIQVTGRVGRNWTERPGLVLMIYSPAKSRDRSHYEQFHSYHRRLYERVEPTSSTPFALTAIQRALPGALITWARLMSSSGRVDALSEHKESMKVAMDFLNERCESIQHPEDVERSLAEMELVHNQLVAKWEMNPQLWEKFPHDTDGEYLMLWPGQYATAIQKHKGTIVPSSMRQVDGSAELEITAGYSLNAQ